ncbi:hypothetical protein TRFO_09817 [Tritrichomonas foetus]|uniref:Uncharacterized protein n=1 Tax=Tritrichomonas foetus TaxID=1144522 RepID=A0A1J4JBZ7_9EUKA|nr:hypothetical protein TRFO_09817 [Tritrichomonas foetus]|eukprot:OHS96664.1 hypothetical protein TRFO_09817 [Tritrichomonas foetus]
MEAEDIIQSQIQPQFPPPYTHDNAQAIDWGLNGLVAYASGSCVHLSHPVNNRLEHVGSIEVNPFQLTCVKFHTTLPLIAVGDARGRVFLWSIENNRFAASANPLRKSCDKVFSLLWHEGILLVLLNNRKLVALSYTNGYAADTLRNFKILWEIQLPNDYSRISIDPVYENFYLLSGNKSFSVYRSETAVDPPIQVLDDVSLTNSFEIRDIQWALHFPNFLYLLSKNSIFLFNIDNSTIAPVVEDNPDSFAFLIQRSSDHQSLLTISQAGGMTFFKMVDDNLHFVTSFNFQPKLTSGIFSSAVISPMKDNLVALFHSSLGLALFDLNKMRIRAVDLTFPSKITAFDSDATRYVTGTSDGYIIIGNLFENNETKRFLVSEGEVITFVSYDAPLFRVYWQTEKNLGIVDVATRAVTKFTTRNSNFVRCFGSHRGAFIVMHDPTIIGVFVEGREKPLIFDDTIADIYVDPDSTQSQGSFTILLTRQTILFYKYNQTKVYCDSQGIRPRAVESKALCFAQNKEEYVTGYSNGLLFFYSPATQQSRKVPLECANLRSLQYSIDNQTLFGLCKEDNLFSVDKNNIVKTCDFGIKTFKVINDSLLLVHANDGIVKFVRISDWRPLSYISKYMPAPTSNNELKYFIQHQKEEIFYSKSSKDAWLCALGTIPMRLHSTFGIGEKKQYEKLLFNYNNRIFQPTDEVNKAKFISLLFLNRNIEASDLISETKIYSNNNYITESSINNDENNRNTNMNSHVNRGSNFSNIFSKNLNNQNNHPNYQQSNQKNLYAKDSFNSAVFSTLIIMCEDNINERAKLHMKKSAISLLSNGKYDDASILFRLAKLDKEAAEYFIDSSQFKLATRFIRNTVEDEKDCSNLLFRCGCRYFEHGKLSKAIPYFAGSGQFHAVLFVLFSMGNFSDAYFLMKYLQENEKLFPVEEKLLKHLPGLQTLADICDMIEVQFRNILQKLNISL